MWYLWCEPCSSLVGKEKMASFEQYFIEDQSTHKEHRNIYYTLSDDEMTVRRIPRCQTMCDSICLKFRNGSKGDICE